MWIDEQELKKIKERLDEIEKRICKLETIKR